MRFLVECRNGRNLLLGAVLMWLSLVRVHCKEAREEKLVAIKVANTKKHDFQSFMETFIAAATRIADGIDLDEFVEPASPPPAE